MEPVKAGFPSPADGYIERKLDLNDLLIKHPAATFFVRVQGNSMEGAGIRDDDILIVDRALSPTAGKIAIAIIDGEFTVKRIHIQGEDLYLMPDNPSFAPLKISPDADFRIWGIVTYVIHKT